MLYCIPVGLAVAAAGATEARGAEKSGVDAGRVVVDGLWLRGAVWKKGTKSRRWLEAPFEPTETGHGSWLKVAFYVFSNSELELILF